MIVETKLLRNALLRLAAGASLLIFFWLFDSSAELAFRLCGYQWLTGRPCPLCGLTRAMSALAKGHLSEAVRFNALSPLGFLMLFALFWNRPFRTHLWTAGIATFSLYGICRIFLPAA